MTDTYSEPKRRSNVVGLAFHDCRFLFHQATRSHYHHDTTDAYSQPKRRSIVVGLVLSPLPLFFTTLPAFFDAHDEDTYSELKQCLIVVWLAYSPLPPSFTTPPAFLDAHNTRTHHQENVQFGFGVFGVFAETSKMPKT
jgi:hypothetical protein